MKAMLRTKCGEGCRAAMPPPGVALPTSSHRKPCGPCLLGSYGSFSTLAPLITSVAMGDGFDLQPLCPPCRSGWDWKFQPSHGGSPGNQRILVLSKGFPKIASLTEQRHFDCFPSLGDSRGFQSSVQEAGVRPSVCFFLEITAPQLVSQKQRQRHKFKKSTYFKMLFDRKANISKTA